ncbi:alanine racemase [Microbacterium mangrovi]|uniref:Alanine racemase n=1 Tax=Microbacterium mangrovi TaxID=1348253 RepID=A0A0B2A719_9MICO|nr:alanine racemase [Microbacterium mangrovi]KHK97342.1 alanine racemase [Microbacterium mangrovi]
MSTRLDIDLDALRKNLAEIAARVAPARHMLVVKDDAYGHGLTTIAQTGWDAGVRWFGSFDVAGGRIVRDALGPDARIFAWMIGSREDARLGVKADLDLGVGDTALLEDAAAVGAQRVHLKIDTGLHRNGIRPEEWPVAVRRAAELERSGAIRVVGVWSHIAEASDAEDDAARAVFDWAVAEAQAAGLAPRMRHLAASAASFARSEFRYDMVRVGAFAYGIHPAGGPDAAALGIRPIATLAAPVTAAEEEFVRIGIGMLDGIPSTLAGRVHVGTPGGPRRLVRIDAAESVVAAWPGAAVGDEVAVYGPGRCGELTATDLAESIDTIGEEIALRVSQAVPRSYLRETAR